MRVLDFASAASGAVDLTAPTNSTIGIFFANSCVCYVLGFTSIDPIKHELLLERSVSGERREPPDIDVDFEHERREEIIQWIYETYGSNHSALTAVVSCYHARGGGGAASARRCAFLRI